MLATVSTGKSGGTDYLEDGKDKNRLLTNGDIITRDMLDTRVTLQGDLRATNEIIESNKNKFWTKDYYHITQSFKENVSIEDMKNIAQENENFYLVGFDKSEYNIYTEYHIPKENAQYKLLTGTNGDKKYYDLLSNEQAKQFKKDYPNKADLLEKRYPHIHTIIPRKNLLTDTQIKITDKAEIKALNSHQEYINIKYGLESPKENKRDITNQQYKASKYNDIELNSKDFKDLSNAQTKKLLSDDIYNQIINGTISSYKDMMDYLTNQDYITSIKEIQTKKNNYVKIKIDGQEKYSNLRAEIFTKDFYEDIKINFDEKTRRIEGKSLNDYKADINTYKERRQKEVSKRYDTARSKSLKIDLIEQSLKDKFENKTISNTNTKNIINDLDNGNSVFLTGGAGVGKSHTTNEVIKHYEDKGLKVAKLGSTGIAATNINGQTLHSFLEIGIKKNLDELIKYDSDKSNFAKHDKLNDKIRAYDLIVIDEISMVSKAQMEMIHHRLDTAHYKGKIMLVGDFNQLPPVSKDEKVGYAFESKAWKELKTKTHELTVIKRSDNKEFAKLLNRLRYGYISKEDNKTLLAMQESKINENKATYIYSTNKAVKEHNKAKLDKLDGVSENYKTNINSNEELTPNQKYKLLDETPLYDSLEIKEGSPVLITSNDKNLGVANGDKGIYLGMQNNKMQIKLNRNDEIVSIEQKEFKAQIEENNKTISATITNFPVRPAFAITTHKSQGMSIDNLAIDPNKQFEKNQFYVAVSRAKNPDNLKILPLDSKYKNNFQGVVKQDNKVLDFYHPTLRTKELKQFDKEVQTRVTLKQETYFKNLQKKKDESMQVSKQKGKSSTLKESQNTKQSIYAKSKEQRLSKQYTRNKVQELRDKFKEHKSNIKAVISSQGVKKLNHATQVQQGNKDNSTIKQTSKYIQNQQAIKQLIKEKG